MKLIDFVSRHNTRRYLIGASILALIGMVLIFTQFFGAVSLADDKALDMLFNYDQSTFYNILHSLNAEERLAYKMIHIGDYLFIIGLYPLISMSLSRVIDSNKRFKYFILLPLLAGLFDFLENVMMDVHLYAYPSEIIFMGSISGVFSTLKFLLLYASVILLLVFGVYKLIRRKPI